MSNINGVGKVGDMVRKAWAEREEQKPVAYMRKWKFDGEEPKKERNESGKMAWPFKFKLHPVTVNRCLNDDIRLYAAPPVTEHGHVTVTTDESGRAVAVTRQDDEHRILSVIWEAPATAPVRLTNQDFDRMYNEAGFEPNEMRESAEHMFNAIQSAVLRANGFKVDNQ